MLRTCSASNEVVLLFDFLKELKIKKNYKRVTHYIVVDM